jgi:glycosyltransferase involved in cell wall biosynthesis
MNNEYVHIGMPVFNGERYLAQVLESWLHQTYDCFEVLVVDNASTDGTGDIARTYAEKDHRIRYVRQTDWVCSTANWRRTYELAARDAKFFAFASDDDLVTRDYLESLLPPLLNNPNVVLSFSRATVMNEEGHVVDHAYHDRFPGGSTALKRIRSIIWSGKYTAINGLIRTEAITWTPLLYDASFGSDLWFLLRLASVGEFCMVEGPILFRRTGGISETGTDPSTSRDLSRIWNIGNEEWNLIRDLNIGYLSALYTYYALRIRAKTFFPQHKKIDWFLRPLAWSILLSKNSRALGLRSRLRRRLHQTA